MGCGKFCAAYCGAMCFVGIFWNVVMGILEIFRSQYLLIQQSYRTKTYVGCFIAAAVCLVFCVVCCVLADFGCGRKRQFLIAIRKHFLLGLKRGDQAIHLSSQSAQIFRLKILNEKFHRFHDEEGEDVNEYKEEEEDKQSDWRRKGQRREQQWLKKQRGRFQLGSNQFKARSITDNTVSSRVKAREANQRRLPRFGYAEQRPRNPIDRSSTSSVHKRI